MGRAKWVLHIRGTQVAEGAHLDRYNRSYFARPAPLPNFARRRDRYDRLVRVRNAKAS
jgi:hypothetical protein